MYTCVCVYIYAYIYIYIYKSDPIRKIKTGDNDKERIKKKERPKKEIENKRERQQIRGRKQPGCCKSTTAVVRKADCKS